jgi:hypothetical protein
MKVETLLLVHSLLLNVTVINSSRASDTLHTIIIDSIRVEESKMM